MPGPNEPISSAQIELFILPGDRSPNLPLGLVENCRLGKRLTSEMYQTLGNPVPADGATNNEVGEVSWTKVHTVDDALMRTITPEIAKWTAFKPFNLLGIDPDTKDPIFLAVGCRPQSVDMNFQGGTSARHNYSATCRYVLLGGEVKKAAA